MTSALDCRFVAFGACRGFCDNLKLVWTESVFTDGLWTARKGLDQQHEKLLADFESIVGIDPRGLGRQAPNRKHLFFFFFCNVLTELSKENPTAKFNSFSLHIFCSIHSISSVVHAVDMDGARQCRKSK